MDWKQIVDSIFKNRVNYSKVTDIEKENSFYIINKKFYLNSKSNHISQSFNNKYIDRASALDLWYLHYKGSNNTPFWYWAKSKNIIDKSKSLPKADKELIMEYEELDEMELEFLLKHYKDDVDYKIKLLKRLE